jgi:Fe-S cluster assembly protein SufD
MRAALYDTDAMDPSQAFVDALRAALADGAWWSIPAGTDARQPLYLACGADAEVYWQAQHGIRLDAGARACWVTHHYGAAARALGNQRLRIELGPRAELTWIHLQDAGPEAHLIESVRCVLAEGARLDAVVLNLGAAWVHQRLELDVVGPQARVAIDGLTAVDGRRHLDTQLTIRHRAIEQHARCRWRALATDRARAVLGGRIEIHPGAVRTDAALRAHNVLLSERAEIDCKPELEIHADDVQAAHGASVGQLDPEALFYLQARGLDPAEARRMLISAFAGAVLERIVPTALQEELGARLATQVMRWA